MVRVHFGPPLPKASYGGLAQLGERLPCKQEVTGSIPVLSTTRNWLKQKKEFICFIEFLENSGAVQKPSASGFWTERRNKGTAEIWNRIFQIANWDFDFDDDAPWKLNIVIMMQLWEGNIKGNLFLKKLGKIQFWRNKLQTIWACIILLIENHRMDFSNSVELVKQML